MRAILIDPQNEAVTEVEYDGDYKSICKLIDAELFDCVRLGDGAENTIYVDDEGLLNGKRNTVGMFRVEGGNPAYLAGKGLILATDSEGESIGTELTLEEVRGWVAFGCMALGNERSVRFISETRTWRVE
jgi:hypothetical protein